MVFYRPINNLSTFRLPTLFFRIRFFILIPEGIPEEFGLAVIGLAGITRIFHQLYLLGNKPGDIQDMGLFLL